MPLLQIKLPQRVQSLHFFVFGLQALQVSLQSFNIFQDGQGDDVVVTH